MEEHNNIPQLRFPEYTGEWERKRLGEVGDVKMCRRIFNDETSPVGEIPFYKIGTFGKEADAFIPKELYLDYRRRFSFPKKGDILISAAGTIGRIVVFGDEDAYYQDSNIVWIDNDNSNVSNEFLFYILQIVKYNTEGGTIQRLYNSILKSTKFSCPTLPEQTRIATFFKVLDKKIAELKQKKSFLEQYKKGVTQKLFSQELRFKDDNGKGFPEWEKKKLGEIAFKTSSNIAANAIEENYGEYIIYGASGVLKKVDFYREEEEYISIVKDGAGVGRVFLCDAKSSVLGTLDIIKPIETNLFYLFYLLQQTNFLKYVTGSTIPHIYYSDYKAEKIIVPCIEEQAKIANFLTAIDEKINYTQIQIQQTEQYKKGLLQTMFC